MPALGRNQFVLVLYMRSWKALERIESIDAASEICGFQNCAKFRPAHKAESTKDSALYDGPLDGKNAFEDLVKRQESGEDRAAHIFGKGIEAVLKRILRCGKEGLNLFRCFGLRLGSKMCHGKCSNVRETSAPISEAALTSPPPSTKTSNYISPAWECNGSNAKR